MLREEIATAVVGRKKKQRKVMEEEEEEEEESKQQNGKREQEEEEEEEKEEEEAVWKGEGEECGVRKRRKPAGSCAGAASCCIRQRQSAVFLATVSWEEAERDVLRANCDLRDGTHPHRSQEQGQYP